MSRHHGRGPRRVDRECPGCGARWVTHDPLDPEWHRPDCVVAGPVTLTCTCDDVESGRGFKDCPVHDPDPIVVRAGSATPTGVPADRPWLAGSPLTIDTEAVAGSATPTDARDDTLVESYSRELPYDLAGSATPSEENDDG